MRLSRSNWMNVVFALIAVFLGTCVFTATEVQATTCTYYTDVTDETRYHAQVDWMFENGAFSKDSVIKSMKFYPGKAAKQKDVKAWLEQLYRGEDLGKRRLIQISRQIRD